jgi:hypothetical protein
LPALISSRLLSISGDLSREGPAIYLHILWDPLTGLWSYNLYVGQSENLKERLKRYQNPWYRTKHPSLHYHVWDSLPAKESAFVVLAQGAEIDSITLNLLEAWGTLIFQTLPKKLLLEDLPEGAFLFPQAGSHLNVAHPLWQRFSLTKQDTYISTDSYERKENFSELIRSSDGMVKGYYLDLRQAFLDLKDSPNPALRNYYLATFRRSCASRSASVLLRIRHEVLGGATQEVSVGAHGLQVICFAQVIVRISRRIVHLDHNAKVYFQGFLTPGINTNMYAADAMSDDPARRLAFRLTGESSEGHQFQVWLTANGDQTVKVMNTFVDVLEGASWNDVEGRPRRMLCTDMAKCRKNIQFTS